MDININVRAVSGNKGTNTSVDKQIANKITQAPKSKTGNPRKTGKDKMVGAYTNPPYKTMSNGSLGLLKKATPIIIGAIVLRSLSKSVNSTNRIIGTITGNRFAESRRADFISAASNPIGLVSKIASTTFQKNFEVQRDNERIDYKRELAGMSLPYREGDFGITL